MTVGKRPSGVAEAPTGVIPEFVLCDRVRKSLTHADIGVAEMAEYFGVSRNTVSAWINGRVTPSVQTLRLWAHRTGVDYEWLSTGKTPRPEVSEGSDENDAPPSGLEPETCRLTVGCSAN